MNRKMLVMKNSTMGLLCQGITFLFTFLTRSLFIRYIGIELLSINSTFVSVLGTISLAELGFHSAIVYSLYKPLHDQNEALINDVMNIMKVVYRGVGLFLMIASVAVMPFLKYILTGIIITPSVYGYFLLQAAASAGTYFFAYKRALLYADQKNYVAKTIDLILGILFNILQCISILLMRSYVVYLGLKCLQTVTSNLTVHFYCSKRYHYLHRSPFNTEKFREVWTNVKNVFAGKFAGYIYSSTDNLVISAFVSTISVGYLVNYTTVTKNLTALALSALDPVAPVIGNYLVENKESKKREKIFMLSTYARYLLNLAVMVPVWVLIDDFIVLWIGKDMVLPRVITILLAIDCYISLVHSATLDFINGEGLFQESKKVEIRGAVVNVITSVCLAQFMGMTGVLAGTVISQLCFWTGRSYIVYIYCIGAGRKAYAMYWLKSGFLGVGFIVAFFLCDKIYQWIVIANPITRFIVGGFVCEMILFVFVLVVFSPLQEQKTLKRYAVAFLRKKWDKVKLSTKKEQKNVY